MAYNLSIVSDIIDLVQFLSDAGQLRIIKASIAFLHDEEYELDEVAESVAFKMLMPMLSDAKDKQKAIAEKNRANGSKGGRKKTQTVLNETQKTQSVILGSEKTQKEPPPLSPSLPSPTPPTITPPIIPQENKSSSSCAHTREEDFGLQVGVIATIERYEQQYKKEGMWAEVAMQNHIKVEEVQEIFKNFIFDQKHNATEYSGFSDFKRHFLNYTRRRASAIWAEKKAAQEKQPKPSKNILEMYG